MAPQPVEAARRSTAPPPPLPRILIVDDSVVARTVITRMLETSGIFAVAGAVADATAALVFLRAASVDAILLDIQMPGVDGLTALPELLAVSRGAKVLIVSSSANDGGAATVQALALGAADTLEKPGIGAFVGRFSEVLLDKLQRLIASEVAPAPAASAIAPDTGRGFDIVAIGASTGGIHALSQLLAEIPPTFQLPILITQHLPDSFMSYFAAQVAVLAKRPCDVATDCMRIRPGRVILAPGNAHLRIVSLGQGAAIRLSTEKSKSGCLPSVDPMLESVADVYGVRALAVVLSGIGRDGSIGAARVTDAGGAVIVQSQESSVVWGMPGAIANAGKATAILPPAEIGRMLATRKIAA